MRKIVKVGQSYLLCLFLLVAITAVAQSVYAAPEVIYVPYDFPERCAVNLTSGKLRCSKLSTNRVPPKSFCKMKLRGLDIVREVLGLKTCARDISDYTGSTKLVLVLLVDDLHASEGLRKKFRPSFTNFEHGSMIAPTGGPVRDGKGRLLDFSLIVGEAMFVKGDENGKPFTEKTWERRIKSLLDDTSAEQARLSKSDGGTDASGDTGDEAEVSSSDESARSRKGQGGAGKSGTYREEKIIRVPFYKVFGLSQYDNRSLFLRHVRGLIDDWMVKKRAHNFVFDSQELPAIYDKLDNAGTQPGFPVKLYVNLIRRRSDRRIMKARFEQRAGSASESDDDREEGANNINRTNSASSPAPGDTGDETGTSSSDKSARSRQRQGSSGKSGTYRQQRIIKIPFDDDNRSLFLSDVRDKITDWMVTERAFDFAFYSQELSAIYDELDNADTHSGTIVKLYVNLTRRRSDNRVMNVTYKLRAGSASGSDDDREEGANNADRTWKCLFACGPEAYIMQSKAFWVREEASRKVSGKLSFLMSVRDEIASLVGGPEIAEDVVRNNKGLSTIYWDLITSDSKLGSKVKLIVTIARRMSDGNIASVHFRRIP